VAPSQRIPSIPGIQRLRRIPIRIRIRTPPNLGLVGQTNNFLLGFSGFCLFMSLISVAGQDFRNFLSRSGESGLIFGDGVAMPPIFQGVATISRATH